MIIEGSGSIHRTQAALEAMDFQVLRFTNEQAFRETEQVLAQISVLLP